MSRPGNSNVTRKGPHGSSPTVLVADLTLTRDDDFSGKLEDARACADAEGLPLLAHILEAQVELLDFPYAWALPNILSAPNVIIYIDTE